MTKKSLLALLFLMVGAIGFAQMPDRNVFDVKTVLPTSPDAAMLGRFGDIPVSYYTGTADVSVPLYSIKEGGLEIPIVLKYHGSGIKVEDEAGWVGLGWSLEPAGSIIQHVLGREDRYDYIAQPPYDGYDYMKDGMLLSTYSSKYTDNSNTDIMTAMAYGDGQPDIFYFNFPGMSGKFYINPETGEMVQINKKASLNIVKNSSGWTITTLDGNKFFFTVLETASIPSVVDISGNTWKLSKIQFANGREVNFEYSDGYYESYYYTESWHDSYPFGFDGGGLKAYSINTHHNIKYLKRITTHNLTVDFLLEDRDDMFYSTDNDGIAGNGTLSTKRLKSIVVKDVNTGNAVKSFDLAYNYFPYSTVGSTYTGSASIAYDKIGKRLKLLSVVENGYTSAAAKVASKPFLFGYEESILLPLKTSFARDFWGYYNGKNNTMLLPNFSYYKYSGFPEYTSIPDYVLNSYGTAANRNVNASTLQAGILKKITYPTGGYTVFNYETNSFGNYNYPDIDQINSATVNEYLEDKNVSGNVTNKQFTISFTQNVHFQSTINRGPNTSNTFENLLPSTITLVRVGSGGSPITPIKTWQMIDNTTYRNDFAADGMVNFSEDLNLTYVAGSYYVLTVSLPDALGAQNNSTNQAAVASQITYSNTDLTTLKSNNGAGVRIKSIQNYSSDGVLATQKTIGYLENGVTSGILMTPLKHFYKKWMYASKITQLPGTSQNIGVSNAQVDIWFIKSDSYVPFSSDAAGAAVGYSKVQETNYGSPITNGVRNYYYNNVASNFKINNPNIPNLLNGLIYKEDILNASADTLKKIEYKYLLKDEKFFRGFKVSENFIGYQAAVLADPAGTWETYPDGKRFTIDSYPNNAAWYVLDKKIVTDYFGGVKVKTDEEFTYNILGQVTTYKTYNSNDQTQVTNTKYTLDGPSNPTTALLMYLDRYNEVIEQSTVINGTEIAKLKNNYAIENLYPTGVGLPVLTSTESSYNGGAFTKDLQILKTSDYNQPVEIRKDSVSSVMIYSFKGAQPVAYLHNTTLANVQAVVGSTSLANFFNNANPSTSDINTFLAPLRTHTSMRNTFITSYTYLPLKGVASETDTKGMTTSFEYDDFSRLLNVKDQNGYIVKNYNYNISGIPTFSNTVQSQTFTKACTSGYVGSSVTYTVPADTYTSVISQTDANNQALADITANGQNYANTNGTCVIPCTGANCSGEGKKCVNNVCETGTIVYTGSVQISNKLWECTYHYLWSDGSVSQDYVGNSPFPCPSSESQ